MPVNSTRRLFIYLAGGSAREVATQLASLSHFEVVLEKSALQSSPLQLTRPLLAHTRPGMKDCKPQRSESAK